MGESTNRYPRFRDLAALTRFTFVRHGESVGNKRGVMQGHNDSPLSETGREHARAAGVWLKNSSIDLVFTSPLKRSIETALIISRGTNAPEPLVMEELKELDTGLYSGVGIGQASRQDPETYARFQMYSWDAVPGAESRESLLKRALGAWEKLIVAAETGHQHILCVSHGGMLQWMIKATLSPHEQRWMPVFGMANCGISVLQARSTSIDHDGELPVQTGFFANWDHINQVPYGDAATDRSPVE